MLETGNETAAERRKRIRTSGKQQRAVKRAAHPRDAFHKGASPTLTPDQPTVRSIERGGANLGQRAPPYAGERLLRMRELTQITGLGRSTIYRLIGQNRFPAPLHPFPKIAAWRLSEIEHWVARRCAGEPI
jgi:prophage regulatory protein